MFNIFRRREPDITDALAIQTIGGQSVLYRLFREGIGCEDSHIRRLELTYFAAAVTTFVYMRLGRQSNRDEILDSFTRNVLTKSIPSSKEKISFADAVGEYQRRFAEYNTMLPLLFSPNEVSGSNPGATLLMHAFECVSQSSARGHMTRIVAASGLIQEYVLDHVDFVKQKL